ncbi:MAG: hypothetical protein NC827_04575 [Candidatus Omnitrophica bacterium]|nr:hypothetical protein [Candidatus Omnitrophota bacterium]MCM8802567.1 hypothetical protein [Candidatus Omnitrophota bacterium]
MKVYKPLEEVFFNFKNKKKRKILVKDGKGDIYFEKKFLKNISFNILGYPGIHTIEIYENNNLILREKVKLEVETEIKVEKNKWIERLFKKLIADCQTKKSKYVDGKIVNYYVHWLRDDTHCKKAYRYWEKELKSMIDLFLKYQNKNGMIYDLFDKADPNYHYRQMVWGKEWARYIDNKKYYMERIPVEADVEYLAVENVYYTWQATGNDEWLEKVLPKLEKAMKYLMTDKLRWSKKYGLIKRGFTIDTWDFQPLVLKNIHPEGNKNKFGLFDFMWIDRKTPFFIFHGDNTGFYHSSLLLSEMFGNMKDDKKSNYWKNIAKKIKKNIDKYLWNGNFYYHLIPAENTENFKIDNFEYKNQISLSNSYALNRKIGHEKSVSIIKKYIELKEITKNESFAEWFTVYPSFPEGIFHIRPGDYMNGGISTIVAGELAKGSFNNGFEWYGIDILKRINEIIERDGYLHCVYRPYPEKIEKMDFKILDLRKIVNRATSYQYKEGWLGKEEIERNDMRYLKYGIFNFHNIPYEIINPEENDGKNVLIVGEKFGNKKEIEVGDFAGSIYFFHTGDRLKDNEVCGIYTVIYQDGDKEDIYLIKEKNITGWWNPKDTSETKVVWHGKGGKCDDVGFNLFLWNNPFSEKKIKTIKIKALKESNLIIFAITLANKKGVLPGRWISYGIPDNWGMTSLLSAIIEGLCGIKDKIKLFEKVEISPRWETIYENNVFVSIKYGPSDGYIAYKYKREKQKIIIDFTGSGNEFYFNIMMPYRTKCKKVIIDSKNVKFKMKNILKTFYVNFKIKNSKGGKIEILI